MKTGTKIIVAVIVVAAAGIVVAMKDAKDIAPPEGPPPTAAVPQAAADPAPAAALPHLIDLGADKCIPCKAMAPILEALRSDFQGRLQVTFIDVWKDEQAGQTYGIQRIPTQIFIDAQGVERFRHEGFYSREQILDKWRELGYEFAGEVDRETGS